MRTNASEGRWGIDAQASHEHACGLVDLDAFQGRQLLPGVALADGIPVDLRVHQVQQRQSRHPGGQQPPGQPGVAQRTGSGAEQIQRTDGGGRDSDRKRIDGPDTLPEHGRGVRRPPRSLRGAVEVLDQDWTGLTDRLQTGTFTERELEFVEPPAQRAAGTEGAHRRSRLHEGDSGPVDVEEVHAGLAQPISPGQSRFALEHGRSQLRAQPVSGEHSGACSGRQ